MGINKDTNQERNIGQGGAGPRLDGERSLTATDYNRYFADRFTQSQYFRSGSEWNDYEPAYQYGYQSYDRYRGRPFEEVEGDLAQGWNTTRRASRLGWSEAKHAVREGWHYLERAMRIATAAEESRRFSSPRMRREATGRRGGRQPLAQARASSFSGSAITSGWNRAVHSR